MYVVLSILLIIFALKDHYLNGGSINRKPECNGETKNGDCNQFAF